MRQPSEFVGHHLMVSNGRMWSCRACGGLYVVVGHTLDANGNVAYHRALCSNCLAESYRNFSEGQKPVEAKWPVKLAMIRSERWPAWASKGVFDCE